MKTMTKNSVARCLLFVAHNGNDVPARATSNEQRVTTPPLTASLLAAILLSPAAMAQTVNQGCTPAGTPADNGAAADSYTCVGAHPVGIAYTAEGDLTVNTTGSVNAGTAGVDLIGLGNDGVSLTAGANINGNGGIDASTELGTLNLSVGGVSGGVRALTTGGDLNLTVNVASAGQIVDARVTGGDGDLTLTLIGGGILTADTSVSTGLLQINQALGPGGSTRNWRGMTISAGTGGADLNIANVEGVANGPASLLIDSLGAVTMNVTGLIGRGALSAAAVDLDVTAPTMSATFAGDPDALDDVMKFTAGIGNAASGGNLDSGRSAVDLSGVTTSAELHFTSKSRWVLSNLTNVLSPGTNTVRIDATSALHTRQPQFDAGVSSSLLDFNGGGTLNNAGLIMVGPVAANGAGGAPELGTRYASTASELRIENLDTLNNSGDILLGAGLLFRGGDTARELQGTDIWNDDILVIQGAQFHGEEGSRILMDADLSSTLPQQSCDGSIRRANGDMPAADCVDIRGGGVSGRTELAVTDMFPGGRGAFLPDGITLIDLAGSDPADIDPEAFVLSPDSTNYSPLLGGSIDKGMFLIPLGYDAEAQQFKLATVPSAIAFEQPMMASAAQELWRASSGSWLERQTEMRDTRRTLGEGGGVWTRVSNDNAERSISSNTAGGGNSYTLDTAHDVRTWSLTVGVDGVRELQGGSHWVIGGMVGYSTGSLEFDAQQGRFRLDGLNIGAYAGYVGDHLYADLLLNGQWFELDQDQPTLQLPGDALLNNKGDSQGLQAELGWRWQAAMITLEPMLFFSLAQTTLDDVRVPGDDPLSDETFGGLNVVWDTARSRRAGIGLRGLHRMDLGSLNLQLNLTGRLVEEMDGKNAVAIQSPSGIDALVMDDFSGQFIDLIGGATLGNNNGTVAGFLNLNLQSGDDYSRTGVSVGFRYQW